ncbi:MAG TPA: 16S rRNA (cytidine(1402)-2'-O)-methyltransferase [Bacteroidales bacterium]|nr:16S rRNA (cytidine(1402)-2'-O)-methyltransferase [Bacteroidales bacterium]HNZ43861.1 16S rRNA (cytidine(1402)-2'-O)-methyltransferase [Bacteroidales bacterium]HPB26392.1 16S rRNA (cytidine(1402)-2'-O)-methyltransferase [Bacteroidales bacterium]HQN16887.1 16S rRNA (cytidine(1402)-2'-O)-methyltransferase [Bacteroidales bacterium]HQP16319.1 16S rRNA (cytidine(1402)-2'-O)-methyltransferase [Bacteroidales bacterium]
MAKLFIVPTPIGNLEDITLRALRILQEADTILAEDTRTSGILLKHHGIANKMLPYHQFNEHRSLQNLTKRIQAGENLAMISDAGTPGISDAGFLLIRECISQGIEVECLPGPTAFVPALVISGLPCDRFHFEGFLPHKKGRQTRLSWLAQLESTLILYESPHRLVKTLQQCCEFFGEERKAAVIRELSKIHEEVIRGSLKEIVLSLQDKTIKGEIVIVVAGK